MLNVIHRVKSFKLHKTRHDQKLATNIAVCLRNWNFQGGTDNLLHLRSELRPQCSKKSNLLPDHSLKCT